MRGPGHRQQRILAVLADHPGGLAAENLLAVAISPDPPIEEERKRMRRALRAMAAAGQLMILPTQR